MKKKGTKTKKKVTKKIDDDENKEVNNNNISKHQWSKRILQEDEKFKVDIPQYGWVKLKVSTDTQY